MLDVVQPGETGITLAKRIFEKNSRTVLAFLSSSPDFAQDGYGVNAVFYAVKPVSGETLDALLDKSLARHHRLSSPSVFVKIGSQTQKIPLASVFYFESRNKQVRIVCEDETLLVSGKLEDFSLPPFFVRTHKSFIVNLARCRTLSRTELLTERGESVPISRPHYNIVSQAYLRHAAQEV